MGTFAPRSVQLAHEEDAHDDTDPDGRPGARIDSGVWRRRRRAWARDVDIRAPPRRCNAGCDDSGHADTGAFSACVAGSAFGARKRASAHAGRSGCYCAQRQPRRAHGDARGGPGRRPDRRGEDAPLPSINVGAGGDYPLTPLNLTFFQGDFGTFPGIGPVPSTQTTLSTQNFMATASAAIVQPLARQYRLGLTVDQLGVAQDIAREDLRVHQQVVVNDVKRAYYLVLQAQSAREAVLEAVRSLRELDRVVNAQLVERKALKADSLDVKTRLAQAETDAFAASNDLATRKEQLN